MWLGLLNFRDCFAPAGREILINSSCVKARGSTCFHKMRASAPTSCRRRKSLQSGLQRRRSSQNEKPVSNGILPEHRPDLFCFLFHTLHNSERVATLGGTNESALFQRLEVLRLAERGRISSLSFKYRRTGLPPSESVSSWYPCWMCENRSRSVLVSFGRGLAAFFFAISHVLSQKV
jgi:hypothetical protein